VYTHYLGEVKSIYTILCQIYWGL